MRLSSEERLRRGPSPRMNLNETNEDAIGRASPTETAPPGACSWPEAIVIGRGNTIHECTGFTCLVHTARLVCGLLIPRSPQNGTRTWPGVPEHTNSPSSPSIPEVTPHFLRDDHPEGYSPFPPPPSRRHLTIFAHTTIPGVLVAPPILHVRHLRDDLRTVGLRSP